MKKRRMAIGAVLGALVLSAGVALAQAPAFFRIGTGGTAGTYYPVGGLIANTISATGGSRSNTSAASHGRASASSSGSGTSP